MTPQNRTELCRAFIGYLHAHPKGKLRIDRPDTWLLNAIISSGGAGNPAGAVIRLNDVALGPVRQTILQGIKQLREIAEVDQNRLDVLFIGICTKIKRAVYEYSPETAFTFGRAQKLLNIYLKTLYAGFWGGFRENGEDGSSLDWLDRWSPCMHIPVDRQTISHFDAQPSMRHLTRKCNGQLISWKWDMTERAYCAFQDQGRKDASKQKYLDTLHFEMHTIWTQPGGARNN